MFKIYPTRFQKIKNFIKKIVNYKSNINYINIYSKLIKYNNINYSLNNFTEIEKTINSNEIFEADVRAVIDLFVEEGFNCIDLGCNIGIHSSHIKKKIGEKGSLYCFDPATSLERELSLNFAINKFKNVYFINKLVGEKESIENFYLAKRETVSFGSSSKFNNKFPNNLIACEQITIDKFFETNNIDSLEFIKADIEGMEYFAFLGAKNTIEKYKPIIVMEYVSKRLENIQKKPNDFDELFKDYFIYQCLPIKSDESVDIYFKPYSSFLELDKNTHANILLLPKNKYRL